MQSACGEHVHQTIEAKQVELSAHQVRHAQEASLRAGQEQLRYLYAEAYGWTPAELPLGQRTGSTTMRQFTKAWVTQWDLLRLSGETVGIEAGTMASNYDETADFDVPAPAAEDEAD